MNKLQFTTSFDFTVSRYSGYTRKHWEESFAMLIAPVIDNASKYGARQVISGPRSHHGRDADELEGFSRSFILASAWLSSSPSGILEYKGRRLDIAGFYRKGILSGTDPNNPEYWGNPYDYSQILVEIASVAWGLWISKNHIWDKLSKNEQEQISSYFQACTKVKYHRNNWLLFNVVTNAVLKRLGMEYSQDQIEENLRVCEDMYLGDGWYSDGNIDRVDYYTAWAFHYYMMIWMILDGESYPERVALYSKRVNEFAKGFLYFFDKDGALPCFGRSMIYRFAYLAPLALGKYMGILDIDDGKIKTALNLGLKFFLDKNILTSKGFLSLGYISSCDSMLEHYSCGGSPYWAGKVFNILLIPENNPFWNIEEEPLPIHQENYSVPLKNVGFVIVGNNDTGHVQLVNGRASHDNPEYNDKYTKFFYSTKFPYESRRIYGNYNCDATLQFSEDNVIWKERWKAQLLYCGENYVSLKYPMWSVDEEGSIVTNIIFKEDVFILCHLIRNTKPVYLREGAYALGFDDGTPEHISVQEAEWVFADDKTVFIRNLFGWEKSSLSFPFSEDLHGSNVRYRFSVTPCLESGIVLPGEHLFISQMAGKAGKTPIENLLKLVDCIECDDKKIFIALNDGEEISLVFNKSDSLVLTRKSSNHSESITVSMKEDSNSQ